MGGKTLYEIWVVNGGILMFVLIPCSVWMCAAIILAMIRLRRGKVLPPALLAAARESRNLNDRIGYAEKLKGQESPLARSVARTLAKFDLRAGHRPHRRNIEDTTEEAVAFVVDDMYESLGSLSTLYTVGPLLGLLGTILGMVKAFLVFGSAEKQDLAYLSNGIQEALITTFWGLVIAIPSFFFAQSFQSRIRKYERDELPESVYAIVESLWENHPSEDAAHEPTKGGAA